MISRKDKLPTLIRKVGAVIVALFALAMACSLCGCKGFYENTGSRTRVGDISVPAELSDGSGTIEGRVLYSMTGADVWTEKSSVVTVKYSNNYTNNYFGIVTKVGVQDLDVVVEPLPGNADTSADK